MTATANRYINITVETVIDFDDETTYEPQSPFANNYYYYCSNGKQLAEGVAKDEDDDIAPKRQMTIEHGLHPLLASMKLFGLYFNRRPQETGGDALARSSQQKWNVGVIYGGFVVALLWLNSVRMLLASDVL